MKQLFQLQKRLAKWRNRLRFVKNGFKSSAKSSKFYTFWTVRFDSNFVNILSKNVSKNVWSDFRISVSAFETVTRKSFNGNFTAKVEFSDRAFDVTITDADIGSRKSLHTVYMYLDHMLVKFKQNCMVRNKWNLEFLVVNHFKESVKDILEDVSVK